MNQRKKIMKLNIFGLENKIVTFMNQITHRMLLVFLK
jgi:hypothetical protein